MQECPPDTDEPLLPELRRVKSMTPDEPQHPDSVVLATRDHEIIRDWAWLHTAEPATGEESASGPASAMKVSDGGPAFASTFPA